MEPILTIDNLNSFGGNMLRQGDKSQLKYRLRDVGNKNLGISGKSCQVKMYGRNYTTMVYETTTTVSSDNTVSFTIDKVLPKGTFYLEFTVGDYIFPTDHREFFEITPSGKGIDANIIEIVGKDVLINAVKSQVDTELQPLVTSLQAAQQAETQRASVEASRVSAEAQRKTDHANRSAELDGKADKVVIKNLLVNGDFSDGVVGWRGSSGPARSSSLTDQEYHSSPTSFYKPITSEALYRDVPLPNNHIIYLSVFVKGTNMTELRMHEYNTWTRIITVKVDNSVDWTLLSLTGRSVNGGIRIDTSVSDGENYFDDFIVIDLTATFGAGNEPTKGEMDRLIEVIGYIDGGYAINNNEMLGHLLKGKANKKQEDWITPTLTNGATGDIQFRKNQFGRVEFKGKITGQQGSAVFALPIGYRPLNQFRTLAKISTGGTEVRTVIISNTGSVYFEQPYGTSEVHFDTISFNAE